LNRKKDFKQRRAPKLVWKPECVEKGALDKFFEDLVKVTRRELFSEEIVLKILREHSLNPEQTLATIKRRKIEYRKILGIQFKNAQEDKFSKNLGK